MRLAIIGTGISGLVAAYRLQTEHDITVFEANSYIGGHTNTVEVELEGERQAIDTGFVVFNDWTYPRFIRLLEELRVASQPTTMSFSVRDERTGLEYNGHSPNTLFAQRRNLCRPSFYRMLFDIVRFNREALRLAEQANDQRTVAEFLSQHRYSRAFQQQYLYPMGAAIWSCPMGKFSQFPLRFIVDFYRNHGLLSILQRPTWRVVTGGSHTYVRAITAGFRERIRLQTPVRHVRRRPDGVALTLNEGQVETFDHVIFACHSDQALRMLGEGATSRERAILEAFPYERNVAVLHTDISRLPRSRRAWASWNYRSSGDASAPASVTYNMNLLQGIESRHTYCVTLNDPEPIPEQHVLATFEYHHPVFTLRRAAAQACHGELLNTNRSSFCGAYWRNGFHEDGVVSAEAVVAALQHATVPQPLLTEFALSDEASRLSEAGQGDVLNHARSYAGEGFAR